MAPSADDRALRGPRCAPESHVCQAYSPDGTLQGVYEPFADASAARLGAGALGTALGMALDGAADQGTRPPALTPRPSMPALSADASSPALAAEAHSQVSAGVDTDSEHAASGSVRLSQGSAHGYQVETPSGTTPLGACAASAASFARLAAARHTSYNAPAPFAD